MMKWGGVSLSVKQDTARAAGESEPAPASEADPLRVLDVGCGIGGTSRCARS
jgi:hypothetical protein